MHIDNWKDYIEDYIIEFLFLKVVSDEHHFLRGPEGVSSGQVEGSHFVQTCL